MTIIAKIISIVAWMALIGIAVISFAVKSIIGTAEWPFFFTALLSGLIVFAFLQAIVSVLCKRAGNGVSIVLWPYRPKHKRVNTTTSCFSAAALAFVAGMLLAYFVEGILTERMTPLQKCMKEASKRPTERGVRLAANVCNQRFKTS